ncbi:MAG: hypothetical protein ACD_37C00582G0002 [uncultured bacterium]|nr:MAG: hypothetical protein ACD_37C00582G0002 [uncultured bacterium]OGH20601.1 MAG: hypothetical protein A2695_00430 [Candidatus Levybacteria bacterium RIFCSPHIGHO2_01_FULL_40_83]OGH24699.1 MAG: hypothetical protein A3D82_00620 [Candidatus Levybacteria bacterium RIFCSPHIGHO2_02_FULL_40_29]OGH32131.1 MAG: hypothetical protein A3E70_03545 [Candidatus Levybacteria bacterium RIFCSPHIGHO2_12_FULL_40_44]OGH41393.1 MAG: hypothetical protein A2965_02195 [Candidatus Levybacteria bacterium RIFCSPLOWO2_0
MAKSNPKFELRRVKFWIIFSFITLALTLIWYVIPFLSSHKNFIDWITWEYPQHSKYWPGYWVFLVIWPFYAILSLGIFLFQIKKYMKLRKG